MNFRFIKQTVLLVLLLPTMALANEVDLSLSITSPPDVVEIGTTVPFHFQITNNSANTATNVALEASNSNNRSPSDGWAEAINKPDLIYIASSTSQGGCLLEYLNIVCNIGSILPSESVSITIEMRAEYIRELSMWATVSADQVDNNIINNRDKAVVNISKEGVTTYANLINYSYSNFEFFIYEGSYPVISADGNTVSFITLATSLEDHSNGENVVSFDRGAAQMELISKSSSGGLVKGIRGEPKISDRGDKAVFIIDEDNGEFPGLFISDREAGETTLISVSNNGEKANGPIGDWDINADGGFVVFSSLASNLVEGDNNENQGLFKYEVHSKQISKIECLHDDFKNEYIEELNSAQWFEGLSLSEHGRYIAFTAPSNIDFSNSILNLYLCENGGVAKRINPAQLPDGRIIEYAGEADISSDDRYLVYTVRTNLNDSQIYKYNIETEETELIAQWVNAEKPDRPSISPSISADGRFITFSSSSTNLVENDNNEFSDIFVYDSDSKSIKLVSKGVAGFPAKGESSTPVISGDGTTIAYASNARNLVIYDLSRNHDSTNVFVTQNPFLQEQSQMVDVSINQTVETNPFEPGSPIVYFLNIENTSDIIATGVMVEDQLPSGFSFDYNYETQGSCFENMNTVLCNLGSIGNNYGYSRRIDLAVKVDEYFYGEVTNTATVSSIEVDYDTSNNSSSVTSTVDQPISVGISGYVSNQSHYSGDELTFEFHVSNGSPTPAESVMVDIDIPGSFLISSATVENGGYCQIGFEKVTCDFYGELADNSQQRITLKTTPSTSGTYSVVANVITNGQINIGNNVSETVSVTIEPKPPETDLAISVSESSYQVYIGENITYKATVVNNGPNDATGVKINSILPRDSIFVSASVGCSEYSGLVTCNVGNLANGASTSVDVVVKPTLEGKSTNSVWVSAIEGDPVTANNTAGEQTVVKAKSADLSITQIDSADPVYAGNNVTYTLTVTNNGISDASSVKVVDTLPTGSTFVSASDGCSEVAGVVTCNVGNLANGASTTVDVVVKTTTAGTITNLVSVSAAENDLAIANNTVSEQTVVKAITADLSITQADSADPVYAGNNVTYTLTVTNNGISYASGVKVVDTLPTGVTFVSASTGCSEDAGVVTCNVGNLANGASTSVDVVVKPTEAGTITNVASASATEDDPVTTNNTTSEDTVVNVVTDMAIVSVLAAPDPVLAGADLTYSVKVKNNAAEYNTAKDVEVTYTFSGDIVLDSASSCSALGNVVTCGVGSMTYNQEKDLQLVVKPDMDGTLDVTIEVSSSTSDPDATNNDMLVTTIVDPAVDIVVAMVGSANPVQVGENLTYTITAKNTGPSTATNTVLTDTLPKGVSVQSLTTSHGTCTDKAAVVDCQLGDLGNDEAAVITITITPTDRAAGTSVNSVTVTSDAYEADATDNTAVLSTMVNQTSVVKISLKGKGSGIVSGSGFICQGTCEAVFIRGETVTLTAVAADDGSKFSRWQGACSGSSAECTFTVNKAKVSVSASFK